MGVPGGRPVFWERLEMRVDIGDYLRTKTALDSKPEQVLEAEPKQALDSELEQNLGTELK
jgi:hypothetical protein